MFLAFWPLIIIAAENSNGTLAKIAFAFLILSNVLGLSTDEDFPGMHDR